MIVRLKGGLGNQMFQYAFVRGLQIKYGVNDVSLDDSFFTNAGKVKITQYGNSIDDFNVHYMKSTKEEIKKACLFSHNQKPMTLRYRIPMALEMIFNKKYYHVRNFKYVDPQTLLSYNYLDGSWQSWMYLEGLEETLQKEFTLKNKVSDIIANQILKAQNEESVFLGVRRGDYVINQANRNLYGSLSEAYYNAALNKIIKERPNAQIYVMSDDIEWVKSNIKFEYPVSYRDGKMIGSAAEELMFMASCKHAIIPNSTFHWWGAWLIKNPGKIVVAPKQWFADGAEIDILPPNWTLLDR